MAFNIGVLTDIGGHFLNSIADCIIVYTIFH